MRLSLGPGLGLPEMKIPIQRFIGTDVIPHEISPRIDAYISRNDFCSHSSELALVMVSNLLQVCLSNIPLIQIVHRCVSYSSSNAQMSYLAIENRRIIL